MLKEVLNNRINPITTFDSGGYGPVLRPAERELSSLRQQIFELIRASGRIPRSSIARTLDVSPGSITALTADLIADGYIKEVEGVTRETSRGRPPVALELVSNALHVVGVKLSDENHTAVLTNFSGKVLASTDLKAKAEQKTKNQLLSDTELLIKQLCDISKVSQNSISAIGIGISGKVDHETGVVVWSPLLIDTEIPLGSFFASHFGIPVCFDNDANVLTLAELWFGAGRALNNFAVITVENGVGMGFVSNNQLFRGDHGMGLELGHTKVQIDGALCRCGQRGCLEAYLADYALAREASTILGISPDEPQILSDALKKLYTKAASGDSVTLTIFDRAGRYLAIALSNVIHLFDPKLIILSGQALRYDHLYSEKMLNEMRTLALHHSRYETQIEIQPWDQLVWARGATALAHTLLTRTVIAEGRQKL